MVRTILNQFASLFYSSCDISNPNKAQAWLENLFKIIDAWIKDANYVIDPNEIKVEQELIILDEVYNNLLS